jgi:hypothetical protein
MQMSTAYSPLVDDLGDELAHLVREELLRGWHVQKVMSSIEAQRIKQATDRIEHCTVDGLGQHEMSVPVDAYFAWDHKEPGCWKDKAFRDRYKKMNPEVVVPYTPRNTTILVP